jgi:homogentisate 1,2-dioxygenase
MNSNLTDNPIVKQSLHYHYAANFLVVGAISFHFAQNGHGWPPAAVEAARAMELEL